MASPSAILDCVLACPVLGGAIVFFLPAAHARKARPVALAVLAATFLLACLATRWFDWSNPALQLSRSGDFLSFLGAQYRIGVDSLSLPLLILFTLIALLVAWASYGINRAPRAYAALLQWETASLIGAILAHDLLLLVMFVELALVPLFFLIALWGGSRKEYAAGKFLLFALTSGVLLLLGAIGVHHVTAGITQTDGGTFNLAELAAPARHALAAGALGRASGWLILIAGLILMAAAPVHSWLADVLAETITPVGLLVAACITTLGAYLFLRVAVPLWGAAAVEESRALQWYAAAVILYGALAALAQRDLRRIIAFGSVAQMGYILLGLAAANPTAKTGAAFGLFAHALSVGMLAFISGVISDRTGHADIRRLGGLSAHMPLVATWSAVASLAAMGLPGLAGFPAQLLIILGSFSHAPNTPAWMTTAGPATVAAFGMILTGTLYLWTFQRLFLGAPRPEHSNIGRLSSSEKWLLAIFGLLAFALGILPDILLAPLRLWAT